MTFKENNRPHREALQLEMSPGPLSPPTTPFPLCPACALESHLILQHRGGVPSTADSGMQEGLSPRTSQKCLYVHVHTPTAATSTN